MKRLTPAQALEHPFLRDPGLARKGKTEADVVPHPFGHGVCAELHATDKQGAGYVKVRDPRRGSGKRKRDGGGGRREGGKRRASGGAWKKEREESDESEGEDGYIHRPVLAGEGIAIGDEPCEFHRTELGYRFDTLL